VSYLRHTEQQIIRMACAESGMRKEEELKLACKAKKGDKAAQEALIRANLNLPRAFAHFRSVSNKDFNESDLYSEALFGLYAALQKFDPKRNVRFATYAMNWVKVYVDRYIERYGSLIRSHAYGPNAGKTYSFVSLDEPLSTEESDDAFTRLDMMESPDPTPEENAEGASIRAELNYILSKERFTKLERDIIEHRFLRQDIILEELGAHNGISRERARQVEIALREKLAHILSIHGYGRD